MHSNVVVVLQVLQSNLAIDEDRKNQSLMFNTIEELSIYEKMWHQQIYLLTCEQHFEKVSIYDINRKLVNKYCPCYSI